MSHNKFLPVVVVAALFTFSGNIDAQSASAPGANEAISPVLRIQLVLTRFDGEKKLSSIPYTFIVPTDKSGAPPGARIRMGVDAPIPLTSTPDGDKAGTTISYKSIGTNIDCGNVTELAGGRYSFTISLSNTAAVPDTTSDTKIPLFRRFDASFTPVLRDGQSMQTVVSADPVTGEVVKIDVTLNIVR
jgi:hypothetical protein